MSEVSIGLDLWRRRLSWHSRFGLHWMDLTMFEKVGWDAELCGKRIEMRVLHV